MDDTHDDSVAAALGMTAFAALEAVRSPKEWLADDSEITLTLTVADATRAFCGLQMAIVDLDERHSHDSAVTVALSALDLAAQIVAATQPVPVTV